MKRHGVLIISGVALLSLIAACGDDKKASVTTSPEGNVAQDIGSTATIADGGATGSVDTSGGSCHVTVTGDLTTEWSSGGGSSSVGYGPWVGSPGVTTMIGALDESFFVINCDSGTDDYVGFLTQNDAKIPMEPATYTIPAGTSALSDNGVGMIAALVTFAGSDTNWMLSGDGQLVITAFDNDHIAGTFTLPMTDALSAMTGTSEGDVVVTGEFDLLNPN
ncbi:MAG: hypothetical protein WCC60_07560 [Ilumatobacteraceae bacterium]